MSRRMRYLRPATSRSPVAWHIELIAWLLCGADPSRPPPPHHSASGWTLARACCQTALRLLWLRRIPHPCSEGRMSRGEQGEDHKPARDEKDGRQHRLRHVPVRGDRPGLVRVARARLSSTPGFAGSICPGGRSIRQVHNSAERMATMAAAIPSDGAESLKDPIASAAKTSVVTASAWRWPVSCRRSTWIVPAFRPTLWMARATSQLQAARSVADAPLQSAAEAQARQQRDDDQHRDRGSRTIAAIQGSAMPGRKPLTKPTAHPTGPPARSLRSATPPI